METVNYVIEDNIPKPKRAGIIPFDQIKVKGGLYVTASEGEDLEKVVLRVRNAVATFKKKNPEFDLSVHFQKDEGRVLVYRNEVKAESK